MASKVQFIIREEGSFPHSYICCSYIFSFPRFCVSRGEFGRGFFFISYFEYRRVPKHFPVMGDQIPNVIHEKSVVTGSLLCFATPSG